MERYDRLTPASARDLLFDECEELRAVQERLCALYKQEGFREVMTPSLEFSDVFRGQGGRFSPERMVTATDERNRSICLRPDGTIPIARLAGSKLSGAPLPLRLFYSQQVYRVPKEHSGRAAEFSQVGAELIGESGAASDIEILRLAAQSLCALGGEWRLELCTAGFFKALMEESGADEALYAALREQIGQKSYAAVDELAASLPQSGAARALRMLPRLFGMPQEVFPRARELTQNGQAVKALDGLEALCRSLESGGLGERIRLDLGLVDEVDYYTGVIFRGYLGGVGEPVLSGGRYDGLLRRFGRDLPATGFGINASLVSASRLHRRPVQPDGKIRVALTKGRLEKHAACLFEQMGYDCTALHEKGRKLVLPLGDSGVEVILAKAADVITYVENGVADIGIVGKDTIMESGGTFYEVLDLGFGRCRFAVACREGQDVFSGYSAKTIASKYPRVALSYFQNLGLDVNIVKIEGSVELAPLVGLADAIVDIVETGGTLRENGLCVAREIAPVSARMIVNTASMKLKQKRIGAILEKAERCTAQNC